jgi:hypothetical protein
VGRIFRDDGLNRRFVDDGYVVMPFLAGPEIAELRRLFEELHPGELPAFYPSMMYGDAHYRKAIRDAICAAFDAKIGAMFDGYRPCLAGYLMKEPGPRPNEVPLHVDPSFADESEFMPSVTIWCALNDMTPGNGCLQLVPGSHHHALPVRSISPKGTVGHPFDSIMPLLKADYARSIEVAAGQAIIHSCKLLHGSGQNKSSHRRIAAVCIVTPQEAPLRHSVPVSPTEAEIFEVDESFFWTHQLGTRPTGVKSPGVVEYHLAQFSEADVLQSPYLRRSSMSSRNWYNRISSWIGSRQ